MYRHTLSVYNIILIVTIVLYVFGAKIVIHHIRRMRQLRQAAAKLRSNLIFSADNGDTDISTCATPETDAIDVGLSYTSRTVQPMEK